MGKHKEYHFYLKDKNSKIPTSINLAINKGTFRRKISIGMSILPEWWDAKKEQAIIDNRQTRASKSLSQKVNKHLSYLKDELDDLFDEYVDANSLSPKDTDGEEILEELFTRARQILNGAIDNEKKEAKKSRITPIQFFTDFIEKWSKTPNNRTGVVPSKGTIWNYTNTLRRYSDYIHDNGLKDSFLLFDDEFQEGFDAYLIDVQELGMNTIVSTHSQLKTMLRKAYQKGLLKNASFLEWVSKPVTMYHVYLNDEELKKLFEFQITDKQRAEYKIGVQSKIEDSKNLFIISARTGLRYGDLCHLNDAQWMIDDEKERYFIAITINKTKDRIKIPLHRDVVAIYKWYNGKLPTPIDKGHYNNQIRLCAKLVGITAKVPCFKWVNGRKEIDAKEKWELITSHTGRRSFATNLYLKTNSASYVMSITGHTTEENFRRYVCVEQEQMAEHAAKFINLDYGGETPSMPKEVIDYIKNDALTIWEQKRKIDSLEKSLYSQIMMGNISNDEINSKRDEIARLKEFWGLGMSLDDYDAFMREADEHAQAAERDETPESLAQEANFFRQIKN